MRSTTSSMLRCCVFSSTQRPEIASRHRCRAVLRMLNQLRNTEGSWALTDELLTLLLSRLASAQDAAAGETPHRPWYAVSWPLHCSPASCGRLTDIVSTC